MTQSIVVQLGLIGALHIVAWIYCLKLKGWVSDDIAGLVQFSDRFVQERDRATGQISKEHVIRDYEVDYQGKKIRVKNCGWNPALDLHASIMRYLRLNWGKTFRHLGTDSKGHKHYGYAQSAPKHHLLNFIVQGINLLLGYNLLSILFGTKTAFYSMLFFSVHPCLVQTVGWISGVNYLLSLTGTLINLNAIFYISNPYLLIPAVVLSSAFSAMTLLPGCLTFAMFLILGRLDMALVSGLVGAGFLLKLGRGTVQLRVNAFKEQFMGKSTFITPRKLVVMVKTWWYYVRLILFPKRLGLFHTWGYHYEEPLEHLDHEFWLGLLSLISYTTLFFFVPFPVQFGLAWTFIYLTIFSNLITAQQFVSERYCYYSIFGVALIAGYYLQAYPVIVAFLLGICLMRIWVHLPTFQNEVRFYESNVFNFPDSEVAMGNLGVAYLNHGMPHKATDTWLEATKQNPLYDVPWYNLYSICKQNGDIIRAKEYIDRCLNASTVHFPDQWKKEQAELEAIIQKAISDGTIVRVEPPKK